MDIRKLLHPEWKKLILPIIFILLFLVVFGNVYATTSLSDKITCEYTSLSKEFVINNEKNDSHALNLTEEKFRALIDEVEIENREITKYQNVILPIANFIFLIDPIFPKPCTSSLNEDAYCEYFISKKSYDCLKDLDEFSRDRKRSNGIDPSSILESPEMPEYRGLSVLYILANILLLIIEGYMISSILLFLYRIKN